MFTSHVAETIAHQITNPTLAMLGAHTLVEASDSLTFRVRGSRFANCVKVTLDPSDTYTVEFFKITRHRFPTVKSLSFVHAPELRRVIGDTLGLAVSL
jgi:hypothetical protein